MTVKMLRLTASSSMVELGLLTLWFSYETPIAYRIPGHAIVVRQNDWGATTGKHLNAVDGGQLMAQHRRLPGTVFVTQLDETLRRETSDLRS
jgi:hypothetical protein